MSILYEAIHQGACRTPEDLERYLYETAQSSETSFKPLKATQFLESHPGAAETIGVDRELDVCSQAFHVLSYLLDVRAWEELEHEIMATESLLENEPPADEQEFKRKVEYLDLLYDLHGTPWGLRCEYEFNGEQTNDPEYGLKGDE